MESTAQYWKPVWLDLEPHFAKLHLAQAHSNRAPKGRKNDFKDAKRLTRRLLADELILSFVPDAEQRSWRTVTRGKHQLIRDRIRLQSQREALLEEARIKLSSVISDLSTIGADAWSILSWIRSASRLRLWPLKRTAYSAGNGRGRNRCGTFGRTGRRPSSMHEA
jgi:transposase